MQKTDLRAVLLTIPKPVFVDFAVLWAVLPENKQIA